MPDLKGLPSYLINECGVCAEKKPGECWNCGKEIPDYATPSGATNGQPVIHKGGFQSVEVNHWHIVTKEGGLSAYQVQSAVECRECYLESYNRTYPDRQLKLEELPKVIRYE